MTAHARLQASTPDHHQLTVRDQRFARGQRRERGVDPVAAAWFAALSASFPRGEAMFIDAVRQHRDGVPEKLAEEIRDFIKQEVNHSREHLAFNRAVEEAGYDLTHIDARVKNLVAMTQSLRPIAQLGITCALEHFTAIFAHEFLTNRDELTPAGIGDIDLWLWHSVEEIDHKAVAFDTFLHATRDWSAFKRWRFRCLLMLVVSIRFTRNRSTDAIKLMRQDGIGTWAAPWKLFAYLVYSPGLLRRVARNWLRYFRPGFHPWDHDDRYLIAGWELEQAGRASAGAHDPQRTPAAA